MNGQSVRPGYEYEPVRLLITHHGETIYSGGFQKNYTLQQFEEVVSHITNIPFIKMELYRGRY